ncbi:MAG: hypothetical protein B7X59_06200 [Polaromonas sp. 39-63-203]|jgi:hypothetical protein|uniref:hypothetical protein n=1 Tax=Polaromonas sp. TaxID=1869339 RepID=UPI000BD1D719|nr:hypothetical protein [Polaromonas sp.]OYY52502.1 MAG: hypothetical protein B7Y54_06715 [Polaromonas sp. 35-63-240]OYY99452.1 MAG: hypothetical protein B7Y42_05875 [Polaromonas sp. 28-63-22]OYZ83829.1 MAG: hypothetical protein B7Y03_07065 [Polaromonas sp. 24-62-144]OZA98395.1 MAG: hypothetical protein B7X59_06200 [Polaromonas sp. 39-63-203]HQS32420.1 hypothetical protein [Polaromonas sp.]
MRALFFALMIALLPLRGWMGDAMATEMAVMQLGHAKAAEHGVVGHTGSTVSAESTPLAHHATPAVQAGHDCGESAVSDASDAGDGGKGGDAHGVSCHFCGACHTLALSGAFEASSPASSAVGLFSPPTAPFASAEAALGQKPPISWIPGPYWFCTCLRQVLRMRLA